MERLINWNSDSKRTEYWLVYYDKEADYIGGDNWCPLGRSFKSLKEAFEDYYQNVKRDEANKETERWQYRIVKVEISVETEFDSGESNNE